MRMGSERRRVVKEKKSESKTENERKINLRNEKSLLEVNTKVMKK